MQVDYQNYLNSHSSLKVWYTNILSLRGVIEKFVDWCDDRNQYLLSFAYKFCRGNTTTKLVFYQLWKFLLDTLIINQKSSETIYMEWSPGAVSVEFRDVPQRHCFSLLLSILQYTFGYTEGYTEVKYQLKQSFFSWISNLTNCWVKLAMFYKKGEFNLTISA